MQFVDLAALTIHDVKNRLAILASRAETRGDGETVHDALTAAATLTQLLLFYKAEKGSLSVDIDARVPADLLEELAMEIGKQTALTVAVNIGEAPTLWFYDEALVRMVLLNAIYNALRHAVKTITLSAHVRDDCLEFAVQDDGSGYPPAMLEQPMAMRSLSREGTGLGLYLASKVAALHSNSGQEGSVELRNAQGAAFCLRLPK